MFDFLKRNKSNPEERTMSVTSTKWSIFSSNTVQNKLSISTVYACVRMLSDSVAMTPVKLFEKTESGREELPTAKLSALLKNPYPNTTYFQWQNLMVTQLSGSGNAYSVIEYDDQGTPKNLIFIPSSYVSIQLTTKLEAPYYYMVTLSDNSNLTVFPEDMIHYRNTSLDGVEGLSPIRLHAETMDRAYYTNESATNFVKNAGAMSGIITSEKGLKPTQIEQLKKDFGAKYGGSENAGKIPVLGDGMQYTQLQPVSPQDSDYVNSAKLNENDIMRIFKIPPPMLGIMDSTYANTEQLGLIYQRYTLNPIYEMIQQELSLKLIPMANKSKRYFEFSVDALLNATALDKAEVITKLTEKGVMTLNEARQKYNLKDAVGLDEVVLPLNSAPMSLHEKVLTPAPTVEPVEPVVDEDPADDEMRALVHKLQSDLGRIKKSLGTGTPGKRTDNPQRKEV